MDVGLDKHLIERESNEENAEFSADNNKDFNDKSQNNMEIISRNESERTELTANPTQPPHPTQNTSIVVSTTTKNSYPQLYPKLLTCRIEYID